MKCAPAGIRREPPQPAPVWLRGWRALAGLPRCAAACLRWLFAISVRGPRAGTLIVQPLPGIGDMVWHLPHIHNIAAAEQAPVSVLTKRRSLAEQLFAADPAVGEVLWLERNPGRHSGFVGALRLAGELRRRRYAQAWLLHGSASYAWTLLLAGIPRTIGFGRGTQRQLLSDGDSLARGQTHGHPIALADALLAAQGIPALESEPRLRVDPNALKRIDEAFRDVPQPWWAFGIGCSEQDRQWGAANFARLAQRWLAERGGTLFLLGGPAEQALAQQICAAAIEHRERLLPLTDRPLRESAALLARCALCIANETGIFNVAAAVGIPVVGLIVTDWQPPWQKQVLCVRPQPAGSGSAGISVEAVHLAASAALSHPD